jgi:midasin
MNYISELQKHILFPVQEEEKGIEMSEDFEGKVQDLEQKGQEGGDSDDEDDEEEPDKEMGETDAGADRLDQQVPDFWLD